MKKRIELYKNKNRIMNDAFDRVIVEVQMKKNKWGYKTFLLTGCSTNAGTTTNAINLAVSMASSGWKTVLIDGDMRKSTCYKRLNDEKEAGLSDYLMEECGLEEIIYDTNIPQLGYISCSSPGESPVRLLCSAGMKELVKELKEKYDYVIFDIPSITVSPDASILSTLVDAVILVASLRETTVQELKEAKDKLKNYDARLIGAIINKVEMSEFKRHIRDFDYFSKGRENIHEYKTLPGSESAPGLSDSVFRHSSCGDC